MLLYCDIVIFLLIIIYIIWFIRNAKTRFPNDSLQEPTNTLKQAFFLRKDWLAGALMFKGWYKLSQWCSIMFPIYILFVMAYSNDNQDERIIIYTCLSLIASIVNVTLGFDKVATCFRNAYCVINLAIINYEKEKTKQEQTNLDEMLNNAIIEGEEIIKLIDNY